MTIDFRSNFAYWIFIIWELQFWNKKGGSPGSLRSTEALKMPHFGIFPCSLQERIPSNNIKFLWPRLVKTRIKLQSTLCRTQKTFWIWFRQKADFLIKISTKFLGMVTIRNIEKTTVYFLFSLFIQFSATEIRLVFPQTKFMISWLQWLEKKLGCPCSLVRYGHFSTDRAQNQGKSAMFCTSTRSCARADDAKIERSRDAQCNTEELP